MASRVDDEQDEIVIIVDSSIRPRNIEAFIFIFDYFLLDSFCPDSYHSKQPRDGEVNQF